MFLPADAAPFWDALAPTLGSDTDGLRGLLLAQLARAFADIERLHAEADAAPSPRIARALQGIVDDTSRRARALTRLLGLDPASRHRRADVGAGRLAERQARALAAELAAGLLDG